MQKFDHLRLTGAGQMDATAQKLFKDEARKFLALSISGAVSAKPQKFLKSFEAALTSNML